MQASEVKALLDSHFEQCETVVEGDGSKFMVTVVSELFAGLTPVKKQQLVYAALTEKIAEGAIHAVTIKALTPAEFVGT